MSEAVEVTVSSQLKSANTKSEIENHSGKKNRGRFEHANEDIDKTRSHLNVEFDVHDREELLREHYAKTIEKHNKHNNSAARRWDLEKYLATFEGKKVKSAGKETANERWATASQISYFGSKDSLNPVLDALKDAGASQEEIVEAYASGYGDYIERHNETFKTLQIYHSDVHFDETTPHGHDALVVLGHTEKGRASDSINNALAEHYGSYPKNFKGRQENMKRYRDDNDEILFNAIAPKLEELAEQYGFDIEFQPIRTGQEGSLSYEDYKRKKDYETREEELEERERAVEFTTKAQKKNSQKIRERNRELNERQRDLDDREDDFNSRQASLIAKEKELEEREKKLALIKKATEEVFLGLTKYGKAPVDQKVRSQVEAEGIENVQQKPLLDAIKWSIYDAIDDKKEEMLKKDVQHKTKIGPTPNSKKIIHKSVFPELEQDDGPEL